MQNYDKEQGRKRKHELHIRLDDRELAALKKKKEILHAKNYNDVMRMFIRTGVCYFFDYSSFTECASEIGKIGNNINQIARKVNATDSISAAEIELIKMSLAEIEDLIRDCIFEQYNEEKKLKNDYY